MIYDLLNINFLKYKVIVPQVRSAFRNTSTYVDMSVKNADKTLKSFISTSKYCLRKANPSEIKLTYKKSL